SEVPSSVAGTMGKLLFNEGDVVQVGSVIAMINTGGESAPAPTPQPAQASAPAPTPTPQSPAPSSASPTPAPPSNAPLSSAPSSSEARFYSPLVRNIAQQENISQTELD